MAADLPAVAPGRDHPPEHDYIRLARPTDSTDRQRGGGHVRDGRECGQRYGGGSALQSARQGDQLGLLPLGDLCGGGGQARATAPVCPVPGQLTGWQAHLQKVIDVIYKIPSDHFSSHQIISDPFRSLHMTSNHIRSHPLTSHHIRSHPITSHHIRSHPITSHHIRSRLITSHQITSDHFTSYQITSDHISSHLITSYHHHTISRSPQINPHYIIFRKISLLTVPVKKQTTILGPSRFMDLHKIIHTTRLGLGTQTKDNDK